MTRQSHGPGCRLSDDELFAPIEGIDLATYAWLQKALADGGDARSLLAGAGLDFARWERVTDGWQRRIEAEADPRQAFMLLSAYCAARSPSAPARGPEGAS
jgi:hypothetical protein